MLKKTMKPIELELPVVDFAGIPAHRVLPVWPATTPTGLSPGMWAEIRRQATHYTPSMVTEHVIQAWRSFVLASCVASQPRNVQRVGNRMRVLYDYLGKSQADTKETVAQIWDRERLNAYLRSATQGGRLPSTRQHDIRNLNAMRAAFLGSPKILCVTKQSKDRLVIQKSLENEINQGCTVRADIHTLLKWLESDDIYECLPKKQAIRVRHHMAKKGYSFTLENLRAERLAILSGRPIAGYLLLSGTHDLKGFPFALAQHGPKFPSGQTRRLPETLLSNPFWTEG